MIALAGSYRLLRGERDPLTIDAEANLAPDACARIGGRRRYRG